MDAELFDLTNETHKSLFIDLKTDGEDDNNDSNIEAEAIAAPELNNNSNEKTSNENKNNVKKISTKKTMNDAKAYSLNTDGALDVAKIGAEKSSKTESLRNGNCNHISKSNVN